MTQQNQQPPNPDALYESYNKSLYKTTGEESEDSILDILNVDMAANNSGSVTVASADLGSGVAVNTTVVANGSVEAGKTTYDNVDTGYILGVDPKVGLAKFYIGNSTNYLNWTGTQLIISGIINLGGTNITISNVVDLQTSIDAVNTAGGGTVYLEPGTYTLTADIIIPGGVTLEGISRDNVIISCGAFAVKIIGLNGYTTGTVAVNKGGTTVSGTATVWTNAMVGRYILLDGYYYLITLVGSATSITIDPIFPGTIVGGNVTGANYAIADVNFLAIIRTVTIDAGVGDGLTVEYAQEPRIDNIIVTNSAVGINCNYVVYPLIYTSCYSNVINLSFNYTFGFEISFSAFSNSPSGVGVVMTNSGNATFFDSVVNGNSGNGISMTSCSQIGFVSNTINGNGGKGVEMISGCSDIQFSATGSVNNVSDGYKLTASANRINITGCSILNNGGYGINIAAGSCNNNSILGCSFNSNSSGTISNSGTTTRAVGNPGVVDI